MEPTYPETSVRKYYSTLRKIPEERESKTFIPHVSKKNLEDKKFCKNCIILS